ncbi:MAG TPA: hypothetical protein VFC03_23140 [Acidimicrobiales bacterium]|nr:hypothetical protein [Acidimicrobiales bacterium]
MGPLSAGTGTQRRRLCGRIALYDEPGQLARLLDAGLEPALLTDWRPRWNVGPISGILGVSENPDGERALSVYRWGPGGLRRAS